MDITSSNESNSIVINDGGVCGGLDGVWGRQRADPVCSVALGVAFSEGLGVSVACGRTDSLMVRELIHLRQAC